MEISDVELKKCLEAYNYEVPPITTTTRNVLKKKLIKLIENNQNLKKTIPSKAIDRQGRHTLKSSPSVTFNSYDETIEGEEEDETDEDEDEVEHVDLAKEYMSGNASKVLDHTLNNRDFMAEKERYRKNKSPVASRFQKSTTTTPPVKNTSNYLHNEIYPREIHTTQRRSKKVKSPVSRNSYDNCGAENTSIVGKDSNKELENWRPRSIFEFSFLEIIGYIAVALLISALYEYLTSQDTKDLTS